MMNPIFYFLLALTAVLAATANADGPVLDADGDIIYDGSYYVLPRFSGPEGGGLTLAPRGDIRCPVYIGQESSEVNKGIPVRFSNWRSRVGFVPESENLNIEMGIADTICPQSTYWWVTPSGIDRRMWLVAAGPKPKPEEDSLRSFFQIKKSGDSGYKIVNCPDDTYCSYVGTFVDEYGVRRLVLSSEPVEVVFMKATETETSSKTMSII